MENNPKKSKAFIITFIVVLILLIIMYVLFANRDKLLGTKSASTNQNFTAGSLSQKIGTVVTTTSSGGTTGPSNPTSSSTPPSGTPAQQGPSTGVGSTTEVGGTGNTNYSPIFNPIPTPDNATPPASTTATLSSGDTKGPILQPNQSNSCPDDPLVFTDTEQAKLKDLLAQYYIIAPGLKSRDDVSSLTNDISQDQSLLDQANRLTAECTSEKANPVYTGPQTIKNNPYYNTQGGNSDSYLPGQTSDWIQSNQSASPSTGKIGSYGDFEKILNIW